MKKNRSILYFFLSLILALGLTYLLKEPQFTDSQVYVIFLLFFAIGLWFTEAIPAFAVSLFIMAYLVFALGNPHFNSAPEKIDVYVNTFSSSVIWLMLGGFFLAAAMTKTQLDAILLKFTLRISGNTPRYLLLGLMTVTMVASMIMSNTATTAMVVAALSPLIASMGKESGVTKALLLGVPIAASTGGMATIIGSPPNAIAVGALENAGLEVSFLQWMEVGLPVTLLLTTLAWLALSMKYLKHSEALSHEKFGDAAIAGSKEIRVQRRRVIIILAITVAGWLTGSWHGLSVAAVTAIPIVFLTLTGIITGKDVRTLPWDTLLLVAGGLSLGVALQRSGLLPHYAARMTALGLSPMAFLFAFAYLTMALSNVMSHTATSTVLIPFGMAILPDMKMQVALVIGLAASTALMLPVSTPPNAIAYSTGMIQQKDFRLGGILIGALGPAVIVLLLSALI